MKNFLIVTFIVFFIIAVIDDYADKQKIEEEYGEVNYEFVITDKYETLGSNFHVLGGRATETEYHVVYKYRITNRPNDKYNMRWCEEKDEEVSYSNYRKLNVGYTFNQNEPFFPYY